MGRNVLICCSMPLEQQQGGACGDGNRRNNGKQGVVHLLLIDQSLELLVNTACAVLGKILVHQPWQLRQGRAPVGASSLIRRTRPRQPTCSDIQRSSSGLA